MRPVLGIILALIGLFPVLDGITVLRGAGRRWPGRFLGAAQEGVPLDTRTWYAA